MTNDNEAGSEDQSPQRFAVELLIKHPALDPAEISAELGLEAQFKHRVGNPRTTPKGTSLPGAYRDTRWRHCRRYETTGQLFADKLAELVDELEAHRAFLRGLRSTDGEACVILKFLGDNGYFGDEIPREILGRLADLELDFGIECFSVPQSE